MPKTGHRHPQTPPSASYTTQWGTALAKSVFHLHGVSATGAVSFRMRLRRNQVLASMASQPLCRAAMEACATAHWWARQLEGMGHSVVLIAPIHNPPRT